MYNPPSKIEKLLEDLGTNVTIKEMVMKFDFKPIQTLEERYECIKKSQEEGNFDFFEKIANLLGEKFKEYIVVNPDDYSLEYIAYYNKAYDFDFILSLARFYQNNREVFDGHCDIISRMCERRKYDMPDWNEIRTFWLEHTLNK